MHHPFRPGSRDPVLRSALLLILVPIFAALAFATTGRVRLQPKFTLGETLRYRIDTRTTTTGKTTTPVANPEGESKVTQTISLLVRLNVLGLDPQPAGAQKVRLAAIFDRSHSDTESDAFNPDAPSPDAHFARLQGHSIQFTVEPAGDLSNFQGPDDLIANESSADPAFSWIKSVSIATRLPREGVALGQKWTAENPLGGLPLADLVWKTESTYLRNEPCSPAVVTEDGDDSASVQSTPPAGSASHESTQETQQDMCAVILTHYQIARRGSDPTPQDYLHSGLRSSGSWTGSGESLDSISLSSGLLVSSTQTGSQDMDYEISSATASSRIHHTGHVESQTQINLLAPSSPHP